LTLAPRGAVEQSTFASRSRPFSSVPSASVRIQFVTSRIAQSPIGRVSLARSGYYNVKYESNELERTKRRNFSKAMS